MHAYLAGLGAEHIALHADEVAQVEALLEHDIVQILVLIGADSITLHIHLYASLAVLQLSKASLAHDALAHDTSGNAHIAAVLGCGGSGNLLSVPSHSGGQVNK